MGYALYAPPKSTPTIVSIRPQMANYMPSQKREGAKSSFDAFECLDDSGKTCPPLFRKSLCPKGTGKQILDGALSAIGQVTGAGTHECVVID